MSKENEVHRLLVEQQSRLCYFLLTITGAAIGFYIQKIDEQPLSWPLLFLLTSLIFWGISFYFGCMNRLSANTSLHLNHLYLTANPEKKSGFMSRLKNSSDKTGRNALRQCLWLLEGVWFVILWHIIKLLTT